MLRQAYELPALEQHREDRERSDECVDELRQPRGVVPDRRRKARLGQRLRDPIAVNTSAGFTSEGRMSLQPRDE